MHCKYVAQTPLLAFYVCRQIIRYFCYRQDSSINTAQSLPKLYINTWQWLPTLYTKTLTQNGRLYLCYPAAAP